MSISSGVTVPEIPTIFGLEFDGDQRPEGKGLPSPWDRSSSKSVPLPLSAHINDIN